MTANTAYRVPDTLGRDIEKFGELARQYQEGSIQSTQFKAYRVPMGVYEQRKDEVYMSRIRTTGGVITPRQFAGVIEIGRRYGSNLLHITTRGEIQLQNLDLNRVEDILSELQKIGLATKGGGGNTVRNIIVEHHSGIDADEAFDPTPYAMALTSKVVPEQDSYMMPRKLKIAFAPSERRAEHAYLNDLGLIATLREGQRGFRVYVGGGGGSKPTVGWLLFDFMPVEHLYILVQAVKDFFNANGNRKNKSKARLRFVFYKLGEEETLAKLRACFDEAAKTTPLLTLDEADEGVRKGADYTAPEGLAEGSDFRLWKKRYAERQPRNGLFHVIAPFTFGNIWIDNDQTVSALGRLLDFVARFGDDTIRFLPSQNIQFRHLPEAALPEFHALLGEFLPEAAEPRVVGELVSCTGADTCRLGIGLSKGLTAAIRRELLASDLDLDAVNEVAIHISGCPNSCALPRWADIGFTGKVQRSGGHSYPAYQVHLAARTTGEVPALGTAAGSLSSRDVPAFVRRLFSSYIDKSAAYRSFSEYVRGEGFADAQTILEDYKEVPSFDDDKNYYFDWGADQLFSAANRAQAECSAGMFDMIDVDKRNIAEMEQKYAEATDAEVRNKALYNIVFYASRMLLVTRGVDPQTTTDTFNKFIALFIETRLVDESYRELIRTARDKATAHDYAPLYPQIHALGNRMSALYASMDDALQFRTDQTVQADPPKEEDLSAPTAEAATALTQSIDREKDLSGVGCPMNFVLTKIELASMTSGQVLKIKIDDGAPIDNVPGSVRGEGHIVISQERDGAGWVLLIRKA